MTTNTPIIVALDFDNGNAALQLADLLSPTQCRLKVGKELFTSAGPAIVDKLQAKGFEVFLDLKFHDIPNTVAKAVKAAANLGVWMVNVHASGGEEMLQAAASALNGESSSTKLIAVTVLTSMNQAQWQQLGHQETIEDSVKKLATLAKSTGLDGVVCSAQEAGMIKSVTSTDFLTVTPGIRPLNSSSDDQSRIMTPNNALENGSDFLVIGRPITKADNPAKVLTSIYQQLPS